MSESDIYGWYRASEDYRKAIISIETTPKKASEIAERTRMTLDRVADILEALERSKAVIFEDDKWKATDIAIKVLNKYFR